MRSEAMSRLVPALFQSRQASAMQCFAPPMHLHCSLQGAVQPCAVLFLTVMYHDDAVPVVLLALTL